jgi:hypothetical protein
LYENGRFVEQNDLAAKEWYQKAAAKGNQLAKDALARLEIKLQRLDQFTAINKFKTKDNRDIFGHDIRSPTGQIGMSVDIAECAARCDVVSSCKAFSYDRWKGVCYPKDNIVTSLILPSSTIAVKKQFALPNASVVPAEIEPLWNSHFLGQPIARTKVFSFQMCKAACTFDQTCIAFTFLKTIQNGPNCESFSMTGGHNYDRSADSGYKYQRP